MRARESRRPDRLFDDPLAQAFVDALPAAVPTGRDRSGPVSAVGAAFYTHVVQRTRFFDDYLLDATGGGCRQVVLLAAGLDTRAFRLAWPADVRLFEVDLPDVLAVKDIVLAAEAARPRCARTTVPADLREDWRGALTAAGFEAAAPTAWLTEGLLLYLSAEEVTSLLTTISALSAPGSRFACEHSDLARSSLLTRASRTPAMAEYSTLWKGGLGDRTPDRLRELGWRVEHHDLPTVAAAHGRPIPETTTSGGFLTAVRA
jgi:methyltransferase (TIGR00027 family)